MNMLKNEVIIKKCDNYNSCRVGKKLKIIMPKFEKPREQIH